MGLDCYLLAVNGDKEITFKNPTPLHTNTWRKYYTLHEWVESLWIAAGRPGGKTNDDDEEPQVNPDADGKGYTVIVPVKSEEPMFNTVRFPLSAAQLEAFFKEHDEGFDTPNSVDYTNLTEADEDLGEAEYYRNWNRVLLKMAKAFEAKGFTLFYDSWW